MTWLLILQDLLTYLLLTMKFLTLEQIRNIPLMNWHVLLWMKWVYRENYVTCRQGTKLLMHIQIIARQRKYLIFQKNLLLLFALVFIKWLNGQRQPAQEPV